MNKKYKLFCLSLSALLLAGCDGFFNESNNSSTKVTHNWADKYSHDENEHWYECLDEGCTKTASRDEHSFEDWVIDSYATQSRASYGGSGTLTPGSKHRTCEQCGYKQTEEVTETDPNSQGGGGTEGGGGTQGGGGTTTEHTHSWATTWSSDDSYHWHACTASVSGGSGGWGWGSQQCTEVQDKAAHTWDNGTITTAPTAYGEGVKTFKCSVCQKTKTESIAPTGGEEPASDNFSFNNDINTAQQIHTTNQANFLKYSKEYYGITSSELNSYGASGSAENSFPNQVTVTWNHTVPAGKTVKNYQIYTGQKADLSDGYLITGTTSKSIMFYNAFLGDNYFKVIANFTDGTSETSETKIFKVDATAPRNLKVGTMSNCRDMGGRTTTAGGKIKQGLIYRTSDPATSGVGDVSEWTKRFKIKTEIYVKDGGNSSGPLGSSVKFINCAMDYGSTPYSNMSRNAEPLRKVFSILGDSSNYPLMYHCRIGTDRTGICAVAINGLLGVPFNEIIQDYSFSNFGKIDNQRYVGKTPDNNGDDIDKYISYIKQMPGNNFQEQMYYSLLSIGIPKATLENVINILTEGNKPTLPTNITVANGTALTASGATKKTASDYKNPDVYYEVSGSSKSVSYTYNLTAAKKVAVVCYLGCTNSSDSTKLASGINLKIDDSSKTIVDRTYFKSGFGTTGQAKRTGYMFNVLGEYDLTAGNHTITIAGKNSDTFNIGSIVLITK